MSFTLSFLCDGWICACPRKTRKLIGNRIWRENWVVVTIPNWKLQIKVGALSFKQQTADIYLTRGDNNLWGRMFRFCSCFLHWTSAVYTRFAEYADEISHLGRLQAECVLWLESQTDGSHIGEWGICLIFNRRADLCLDVFMQKQKNKKNMCIMNEWMQQKQNEPL